MNTNSQSISKHKVGRYGEQLVFEALEGAKWANGGFESSKQFDIEWNDIKIDVNSSSVRKRTGFIFSNAGGYRKELVNIFVGIDGEDNFFWVRKGLDKTGFYGRIVEAIGVGELAEEIKKVVKQK